MKTIKQQFNEITKMKFFEIEVINNRTNEIDYIIFDIDVIGNQFVVKHVALTKEQEQSNIIPRIVMDIDEDFSLDTNLQELFVICNQSIIDSDFYRFNE